MKRNNGQWTESRFHSFIKSALRSASSRWPPKFAALDAACVGKKINWKTKRGGKHYKCNCCMGEFPASEVQVDHIQPVIDPFKGFISWDEVVNRLFCEADGYQVLCTECHKNKTTVERQQAKERKDNAKQRV